MNWDCIAGNWQQLVGAARRRWRTLVAKRASERQLAEWLEQQHKVDPIHK